MQPSAASEFLVALDPIGVRDVELVLLGVLPRNHVIGRSVSRVIGDAELTGIGVDSSTPVSGRVMLTDEERTPLAVLTGPRRSNVGTVVGTLVADRPRESGPGRARALHIDDLSLPWARVVVLGRPPVNGEFDIPGDERLGPVLLLVPDHPRRVRPEAPFG